MKISRSLLGLAAVIAGLGAWAATAGTSVKADSLAGRWDASIILNGAAIPFRLDISGDGANLKGTLFNGDQLQTTTSARLENGSIVLDFDHYLTKVTATLKEGQLDGQVEGRFERERYISSVPFHAKRYSPAAVSSANAPSIDGVWEIPYDSPKGEKAWRFIVRQSGSEVTASILRVDGDTGALTGSFQNGKFVLSHFDGSRPLLLEVTPASDGTLEILPSGAYTQTKKLIAYRPETARAKGLAEPANYTAHTTVRDPNETFAFRFPDVNGKIVSNDDPKFKGKVVLAIVTGTWCPNCHDEAQYLVQLYKKYRGQGLEIVALDFEEPEQQDTLSRERAFVKKYGVEYTYLIAGAPAEMWEKVPQGVNLNTWPATFFIGRDGRVKSVHAGFASPASGEFNRQLKDEFTSTIERLLADVGNTALPTSASASVVRK
jgi:thiol-disulfide isomerase/thioredoxin